MIEMVQTNFAAAKLEKFPMIKEALASDIFLWIIYTTVPNLLEAMSITIWILNSNETKHVSVDQIRFLDLVDYEDSCRTASCQQLAIKKKVILICLLVILC